MANKFKNAIRNDQVWDGASKAVELPELEDSNIVSDILKEVCQVDIRYKIILLHIIILTIHLIAVDERQTRQERSINNHNESKAVVTRLLERSNLCVG